MRRPPLAALLLCLLVVHAQDEPPKKPDEGGDKAKPTAGGDGGGGGGGGGSFALQPSGVTVPVWSDIGRSVLTMFAGDPGDGGKFAKEALDSPGMGGIRGALASQQGLMGIFTWVSWLLFLAVTAGGLGLVGARFAKRCGGERLQIISPEYDDYYQYYCMAVSLTGVALMITAVALFLNKSDMGSAINDGYDHYAAAVGLLKGISAGGGGGDKDKDKDKEKKGDTPTARLRGIVDALNTRFRDDFGEFLKRRVAMDSGLPSRSVLSECSHDARSLAHSLSAAGQRSLASLFAAVGRRCGKLESSRKLAYGHLARAVEDATVAERKRLLRKVRSALERAQQRMLEQSGGPGVDAAIGKLASYESDGGVVSWMSFLTGIPMLLVVVIALVAPIVAIAGMGIAAQDHDLRPTVRSPQSNTGGLMLVYSAAAGLVCLIISSFIATQLYVVAGAGEVYVCDPFRSRNFKVLDQMAYALWPGEQRGQWAGFVPSEILSKCQRGGSVSDLQAPEWAGVAKGGGNETKKEDKKDEAPKAPPSERLRLNAELLSNASAARDSGAAVRALVSALGQLGGSSQRPPAIRAAAEQLSRKWRPLARDNRSDPLLTSAVGRYYGEYMGDAERRLRWASAQTAEQGGGGCEPAFQTLNAALLLFCDTFVAGAEGYWLAHVLAFVLLLCFGPICLGMANHFLIMENYVYHGFDDKKVKRREERERLGLVKKKKKKKKKKKEEEEDDSSVSDSSEGDDSSESS
ncbi:hypothetical protein V5799_018401 [Amblyomma americanum]|uniref:Uncharacterized protein n=1 Tax=Amblyomma americanum TaxID=6943 RepID=A0AAQ4F0J8_AMBAM